MNFSKFDSNKEKLQNQYEYFYKTANEENAKKLFKQIQTIYYNEKSKAIGFGKAVKHYFKNVELFINSADIFANIAAEFYSPVCLRDEEYNKYKCSYKHGTNDKITDYYANAIDMFFPKFQTKNTYT